MQTFLPYKSFAKCAAALDNPRLGKQRMECVQIVEGLLGLREGYKNHPASYMWKGYEYALCIYGMMICLEWGNNRRFKDKQLFRLHELSVLAARRPGHEAGYVSPPWFGDVNLMRSHRSNLIRKDAETYGDRWPGTPENMPYLWPIAQDDGYVLKVSKADKKLLAAGERSLPPHIAAEVDNL